METYMAINFRSSSPTSLLQDAPDCIPPSLFSHDPEDTTTPQSWYYPIPGLQDLGSVTRSRDLLVETRHKNEVEQTNSQQVVIRGAIHPSSPYPGLKLQRPLCLSSLSVHCEIAVMDNGLCLDDPELVHSFLPPSLDAFYHGQPPSPPLDTPELVQRSLPAPNDPLSPPLNMHLSTRDLPEACDAEMFDMETGECSQASSSQLFQPGQAETNASCKCQCRWPNATDSTKAATSPSGSSTSTTAFHQPELLTPVTPTISWMPAPPSPPDEPMEYMNDLSLADALDPYDLDSNPLYNSLSRSSRQRSRSVELSEPNTFGPTLPSSSAYSQPRRAYISPDRLLPTEQDIDLDPLWSMDIDDATAPHSPRPQSALLPDDDLQSNGLEDQTFDVDPPPPLGLSRRDSLSLSLPDLFDGDILLSPSSPRAFTTRLPGLEMDDYLEPPSSPHSPYRELSSMDDDDTLILPSTVSPSELYPEPHAGEGLGLFIQPSSVDPPLARSPSPDDDDMGFLDIQLDSACSPLQLDEFLHLRSLRRHILDAERDARAAETELAERVGLASDALLPGRCSLDPEEKRARKHELHVAMEMRAEARKVRKRMKQRNKEIGALLDLKMERNVLQGKSAMRSVAQLVANMVLKRRDISRPLANRKPASAVPSLTQSPLRVSFCVNDLLEEQ